MTKQQSRKLESFLMKVMGWFGTRCYCFCMQHDCVKRLGHTGKHRSSQGQEWEWEVEEDENHRLR